VTFKILYVSNSNQRPKRTELYPELPTSVVCSYRQRRLDIGYW